MLLLSALALLLVAALFAIFFAWRRTWRAEGEKRPTEAPPTRPASSAKVDTHAHRPRSRPPTKDDDGDDGEATLVYVRGEEKRSAAPRPRPGDAVAPAGAHLIGLSGNHKGERFAIGSGMIVGRNPACDLVLADGRISSRHAWIGIVEGKAVLRDLKSTNGTFLNAQTHAPVGETELRHGDTISFGGHQGDQFRFVVD